MYTASLEDIKKLRETSLASIVYCKQALEEAGGDFNEALKILEQKGLAKAASKSERTVGAGVIDSYIHYNKQLGVLLDIRCETDFVARNEEFQKLAHELCLQIAAMNPLWVSRANIPAEVMEERRLMYVKEASAEGKKPEEIIGKIVNGKLESFFSETCLLDQAYIKENDKKVNDLVAGAIAKLGENIKVNSFARLSL
ncbi:MAG: Elongation factor Ts [Parcubacteria group bacterium GW2011_GWB1_46_8]|nr:MAG: Elongation factor Ts [Parcubacteria group bacterium GW2011_GWF1_45_5]KKU46643.1 MAG: Elongation factor Ts [Parcubacteria group bacterium GW2011_GWB1_46_8]KKU47791.1 MAG: Elongation factor Ts [Parcubacteria group bacterium GW2011_GWF2_46_8]